MKNLKRIALAADLTEMDETILQFIKGYDKLFDFDELCIIHQIEIEAVSSELQAVLDKKNMILFLGQVTVTFIFIFTQDQTLASWFSGSTKVTLTFSFWGKRWGWKVRAYSVARWFAFFNVI